jgi:hypothetical protein
MGDLSKTLSHYGVEAGGEIEVVEAGSVVEAVGGPVMSGSGADAKDAIVDWRRAEVEREKSALRSAGTGSR